MQWTAFTARPTLQICACLLSVLSSAALYSQTSQSPPAVRVLSLAPAPASTRPAGLVFPGGPGARNLSLMSLRSAMGLGFPTMNLLADPPGRFAVNAPYSAVGDTEFVSRFPDGNRIIQKSSIQYYRDGQGRTRIERPITGAVDALVAVMINDNVSGQHYILHPQARMAQVFKVPPQTVAHESPAASPQDLISLMMADQAGTEAPPTTVALGQKEIEGLTTTGTRWEKTFAAGIIGNDKPITLPIEQWFSPDLGVIVAASQQTSTGAELTYRLHNVSRSEPDSALFTIPADYTRTEAQSMAFTATATVGPKEGAPPPETH